jgi:hypothetical protein
MIYDSRRGVTALFGGFSNPDGYTNLYLNDMWEWDGTDWTEQSPVNKPEPRWRHAMAYDSARGVTVLFGGQDENKQYGDTWEYGPLPLTAPILATINNPNGNDSYLVQWSTATGATDYTLEEADSPSFASPTVRYSGPNSAFTVAGQAVGTWYYRVRAANDAGHSTWSNTRAVKVYQPGPTPEAPAITSAGSAIFVIGQDNAFTVTATGLPTPAIERSGTLPSGVSFTDRGNGTATLAGTPLAGSAGMYSLTITASNDVLPNATQSFTLTVLDEALNERVHLPLALR